MKACNAKGSRHSNIYIHIYVSECMFVENKVNNVAAERGSVARSIVELSFASFGLAIC